VSILAASSPSGAEQTLQIIGAILILVAFTGAQVGIVQPRSLSYLVLNVLGAGTLAVLAALGRQYGFLLLETVWTIVSVISLGGLLLNRRAGAGGASSAPGRPRRTQAG
jgi:hypothetical protein